MTAALHLLLATLAGAGVVALADQYLVLLTLGLLARFELVQLVPTTAFVANDWFLLLVGGAWLLHLLATTVHDPLLLTAVKTVSGAITTVSGALIALIAAGLVVESRPELQTALYLLTRDAQWTNLGAYRPADWGVLSGGGALAGTLTFTRFLAKPVLEAKTGLVGLGAPLFLAAESGLALILTPLLVAVSQAHPLVLAGLGAALLAIFVYLTVLALRTLRRIRDGVAALFRLLDERPSAGLAVVAEFCVWGSGFLLTGAWARGLVMLALWLLAALLALSVVGLVIAVPCYVWIAPRTAGALYTRLTAPVAMPVGGPTRPTAGVLA